MSVSNLLEKITGLQLQRKERYQKSYLDMVVAVAKDEETNPAEVEAILDSVHKSVDDLRRDVERHRKRIQLKVAAALLPQLERDLSQVAEQIKFADKQLEEAEARHTHVNNPLYARQSELLEAQKAGYDAERQLFDTCDDISLRAQMGQVADEIKQLHEKSKDLATQAAYLRSKADTERHRAGKELKTEDRDHRLGQADLLEKQAKSLDQQIKAKEKEQAMLVSRREEIEKQMRAW